MKNYYVYELWNELTQIVYVGMTNNPKRRLRDHTNPKGKFAGLKLDMKIVKEFTDRKEALLFEGERKKYWGMEWTEKLAQISGGISAGKHLVENQKGLFDPKNQKKRLDGCSKGGKIMGIFHYENETGLFNPKHKEKKLEWSSKGGKKGGLTAGKENVKNQRGIFDPKNKEKVEKGRIKGLSKIWEQQSQPVKVYTKNGQFIGEYPSQNEATRQMSELFGKKIFNANVNKVVLGERKTTGGLIFKSA